LRIILTNRKNKIIHVWKNEKLEILRWVLVRKSRISTRFFPVRPKIRPLLLPKLNFRVLIRTKKGSRFTRYKRLL
jgi:hypothetical protein